jgi:hypothetical protein
MKDNKDTAYYLKNKATYNAYNKMFEQYGGEEE